MHASFSVQYMPSSQALPSFAGHFWHVPFTHDPVLQVSSSMAHSSFVVHEIIPLAEDEAALLEVDVEVVLEPVPGGDPPSPPAPNASDFGASWPLAQANNTTTGRERGSKLRRSFIGSTSKL
jgi:hypothetical protein